MWTGSRATPIPTNVRRSGGVVRPCRRWQVAEVRQRISVGCVFRHTVCHRIHGEACRMSEELLTLLGGLDATPQEIAARLCAEGIRVQRVSPSFQNPIVRYICRHLKVGGLIYV